jgi:(S)-ureidoglycine aminohydrolase
MMQQLGFTRTNLQDDHALITTDTFVRAPLPGFQNATCVVHIGPVLGAGFTMYTVEASNGGTFGPASIGSSRFVFVQDGELSLKLSSKKYSLKPGGYAFIPPSTAHEIESRGASRAIVIEKPYRRLEGVKSPKPIVGDANKVASSALNGDEALQVRMLLPDVPELDFAVNTMTYDPGASLALVEVHIMEHGLVMLEGGGIYRLGNAWYPVTAGDVIYMAPYCPQWFGALGKTPSTYLIYKDWNRHPLE